MLAWIARVRAAGIHVPVRVGLPGPSTLPGLLNFARQCRVPTTADIVRRYGWRITSLFGQVGPDRFLDILIGRLAQDDLGSVHVHLFPMGDPAKVFRWFQAYGSPGPV